MAEQLTPFDPAEHLDTPARVAAFLEAAAEEDDPAFMARALGIAARAHARLHPTAPPLPPLPDDPPLSALLDRLQAMGLRLSFTPR